MDDPLKHLDDGLEADMQEAIKTGFEYWTEQLRKFDAGEVVLDWPNNTPLTREEIVEVLDAIEVSKKAYRRK